MELLIARKQNISRKALRFETMQTSTEIVECRPHEAFSLVVYWIGSGRCDRFATNYGGFSCYIPQVDSKERRRQKNALSIAQTGIL